MGKVQQSQGSKGPGRFRLLKTLVAGTALCVAVGAAGTARATEGGGGAYPNGAEDFMSGAVPPPGTYFINYLVNYSADRFNDNNGNRMIPGFKLNVTADVLRLIHITDIKLLGGYWGMHLFLPTVYQEVTVPGPGRDRRGSLGDIIIDPFVLSWHGKNWHAATGVDIYMPTGDYNQNHLANPGRHYWTFEPIAAATYTAPCGFEASAKLMYDFNTRNGDTTYLSGQEFHMDYALGAKIYDFKLGMAGYYYQQVTNDEVNGAKVPFNDGNRGRAFAFGPAVKYDYKNMSFSLKYLFETAVKNRPEGNNLWFKFAYAF